MKSEGRSIRWLGSDAARRYLIAVVVLAPVLMSRLIGFAPLTHDTYELPKAVVVRALAALALLAWSVEWVRGGRVRWSWWLVPLGALAGWTGLATAFSTSPATSLLGMHGRLEGLLATLTYVVLAFVAMQVFSSSADLVPLMRGVIASGLVVTGYAVLQVFHLDPFYYFPTDEFTAGRVFSTFGNPVFLGGYLVLLIPVAVMAALSEESRAWGLLAWATTALSMGALLGTATRTAWVAVLVEVLVLVVVAWRKRLRPSAEAIGVLALGVCLALVMVVRGLSSQNPVLNVLARVGTLFSGGDGSSTERLIIARTALRAVAERPVLGYGPDRFVVAFHMLRPAEHVRLFPTNLVDNAHSIPLQIAATAGVVAALAWLVSIVWPLVRVAPSTFSDATGRGRALAGGLWVAVAGYALFSLVGISVTGAEAVAWVLLGVLAGASARVASPSPRVWGKVLVAVSAVVVVVAIVWGSMLLAADYAFVRTRMEVRGFATGDPAVSAAGAVALSPLDITYLRQLPLVATSMSVEVRIGQLQRALSVEPEDLDSLLLLRELAAGEGDTAIAANALARARRLAPNDSQVTALARLRAGQ